MKPSSLVPALAFSALFLIACGEASTPASLRVTGTVEAPAAIELGKELAVTVVVQNTGDVAGAGTLTLSQTESLIAVDVSVPASAKKSYTLRFIPAEEGEHSYQLVLTQGGRQVGTQDLSVSVFSEADLYWSGATITEGQILSGSAINIEGTVGNHGSRATKAECLVRIDGESVGSFPVAQIPAGGTLAVTHSLLVSGSHSGQITLMLQNDGDARESDNRFVGGNLVVIEPDRSLTILYAVSVTQGDAFTITARIVNETLIDLPATTFSLFFSLDGQLSILDDALIVADIAVPALAVYASIDIDIPLDTLAVGLPWSEPGTYTAFGMLEPDAQAGNDVGSNQVVIVAPAPTIDFLVKTVSVTPLEVKPGDSLDVSASVDNLGNQAAPAVVSFSLGSQVIWQSAPVTIAAGGNAEFVTTVTVPALADGSYALSATADAAQLVAETDESNNGMAASSKVDILFNADLLGSLLINAPAATATIDPITLTVQWRNRGFTAGQAVTATVWMQPDAALTMADYVTTVTIPILAARAATSATIELLPLRESGNYSWRFVIKGQPGEVFLANNTYRSGYVQTVASNIGTLWEYPYIFTSLSSPTWFDVNDDGTQDVLLGGQNYDESYIVAIDGATGLRIWDYPVGNSHDDAIHGSAALGDVDTVAGDGNPLLFIGGRAGDITAIDVKTGVMRWNVYMGPWVESPSLADMDGDGKLDVIITAGGNDVLDTTGILAVYRGYDGLLLHRWEDLTEIYSSPAVGDLTGDGIPDIVIGGGGETVAKPGYVAVFDGAVTDVIYPGPLWSYPTTIGVEASAALVDVDGDGKDDVIAAGLDGFVAAFKGMGDGAGNPVVLWRTNYPGFEFLASPAIGDVTGDGTPEIIASAGRGMFETPEEESYDSNRLVALALDGTELWRYDYGSLGGGGSSPILADIDGDGKAEIIFTVSFFQNNHFGIYFSKLFILSGEGVVMDIREFEGLGYGTPFITNMGAGVWDIVLSGYSSVAMSDYRLNFAAPGSVTTSSAPWPKFRGNRRNTGRYLDP